jgi:hypothetical protein
MIFNFLLIGLSWSLKPRRHDKPIMELAHIYVCAMLFTVAVRLQPIKSHTALNTVSNRNAQDHSVQTGLKV